MMLAQQIEQIEQQYNVVDRIDLDTWHHLPTDKRKSWLRTELTRAYRSTYQPNDRILFTLTQGDIYNTVDTPAGQILITLIKLANEVDISNFFIVLVTNDNTFMPQACDWVMSNISNDPIPFAHHAVDHAIKTKTLVEQRINTTPKFVYNSSTPNKIEISALTQQEQHLLTQSKTFCMYPWIHLHAYPTGAAYPCCHAEMGVGQVGNCHTDTLKDIFYAEPMNQLRDNMLNEVKSPACQRCYEQEESGFFSGRQSANKHHGHHVKKVSADPEHYPFEMTYWDIRFSNLCNLSCRSCGHIFSSSWYQDQSKLAGVHWAEQNTALNYAGRTATDMWEQLVPHLDYVEQIYFAGGEPLMMKEHYNILDELERRGRFDVRLIYNTNFTHTKLKDREVFDYWRKFDSVAVGASLDAMGPRAEYIRRGTTWDTVERNRELMMKVCPRVDFYVSPTLSIMNAMHLPDFHRAWVDKGYIQAQDLNVNILQDPVHYRIDIAPPEYKQRIRDVYQEHLAWLRPQDPLGRATVGFESAINYMQATDNSALLPRFWAKTHELDAIRNENILEAIPEMKALK